MGSEMCIRDSYEKDIRGHLTGMLSAQHFNFDRDVAGITVNRWAHGYAVAGPGDSARVGRQPFGRLAIANSDSAPAADAIEAMRMGIRAVQELRSDRVRGLPVVRRAFSFSGTGPFVAATEGK